jgi:hypothetical protein
MIMNSEFDEIWYKIVEAFLFLQILPYVVPGIGENCGNPKLPVELFSSRQPLRINILSRVCGDYIRRVLD